MDETLTPQQKLAQGLRNAAAWYDEHPTAPVPSDKSLRLGAYLGHNVESIEQALETIGPGTDVLSPPKEDSKLDGLFQRKIFGDGFELHFYAGINNFYDKKVVRKEVVEKEVVEWVRKPSPIADLNAQVSGNAANQ